MLSIVFQHKVWIGSRPGSVEGGMFLGGRPIDDSTGRRDRRGVEDSKEDERRKDKARKEGREKQVRRSSKESKAKVPGPWELSKQQQPGGD